MLVTRTWPISVAASVAGMSTISRSVRAGGVTISDWLMTSSPPGLTSGSYFSSEGLLKTTTMLGCIHTGEPIGSSLTTTVQLAVPPRISGP